MLTTSIVEILVSIQDIKKKDSIDGLLKIRSLSGAAARTGEFKEKRKKGIIRK